MSNRQEEHQHDWAAPRPNKHNGTALGDLESFYTMALPGTLLMEQESMRWLKVLSGAYIRITMTSGHFNNERRIL